MILNSIGRILIITVYFILYYYLINMGRRKKRNGIPFAIFMAVTIFWISLFRFYPLVKGFSRIAFNVIKVAGAASIGIALSNFVCSVFPLKILKTAALILNGIILVTICIFLPQYLSGMETYPLQCIFGTILVVSMTFLFLTVWFGFRYIKFRDRRQKLVLATFAVFMLNGVTFMIFEGMKKKLPGPLLAQPGFIGATIFFIAAFFSNLRWRHNSQMLMNRHLEKKIKEKTAELEGEKKQKSMLLVKMAHETKTPLALIRGYLDQFIAERGVSRETEVMVENINKLIADVVNVMNLEKLEDGVRTYLNTRLINLSETVCRKAAVFNRTAKTRGISIRMEIENDLYSIVDPMAIETVLNNLLDNALKFTESGGAVFLKLRKIRKWIELTVRDTGIGIPADKREHIFEQFYHTEDGFSNDTGLGIGLYLVYHIVQLIKGEITVDSAPGRGTEIVIRIPAVGSESGAATGKITGTIPADIVPAGAEELKDSVYDESRETILVIEDNREMLRLLRNFITQEYNFFQARDGREALEKLETIPLPDLILSDIMMDAMDGFELFKILSMSERYSLIPFIFLTARNDESEKVSALSNGVTDYLEKPFPMEVLMAKIRSILGSRKKLVAKIVSNINRRLESLVSEQEHFLKVPKKSGKPEFFYSVLRDKYNMSPREIEITKLISEGYIYKEIASRLDLSRHTVESYRKRIFRKCNVQNKTELVSLLTGKKR